MSITERGFEGALPETIRPNGFYCHRRGGCLTPKMCAKTCLAQFAERPAPELVETDLETLDRELNSGRLREIAVLMAALTYGEMIEFAEGLWSIKGNADVNANTLPKIMHAWASKTER